MALDRTVISQRVWDGAAAPVASLVTPTTWGYARDVFATADRELGIKPTADLAAAKALVQQAGVPEPLEALWQIMEPGGLSNYNGYRNPAAVKPLASAFAEADDTARARLVTQAQHVMFAEDML
jgi:ABC-type transport system substrate-binding protein